MTTETVQVDKRIVQSLDRAAALGHRLVIGVNGDVSQIVHQVHSLLTRRKTRPKVVWVYEKELKAKEKSLAKAKRRKAAGGTANSNQLTNLESFLVNTEISYLLHRDTDKALGSTNDLVVLQDFHSLPANALASVAETLTGGGVLLLSISSDSISDSIYLARMRNLLEQLDRGYLVIDTKMTLVRPECNGDTLTNSASSKHIPMAALDPPSTDSESALHALLSECRTEDQKEALIAAARALNKAETVALNASRGRGKSATLGLCVALGLYQGGLTHVAIVAPYLSNVQTLFQFLEHGLVALGLTPGKGFHLVYSAKNRREIEGITVVAGGSKWPRRAYFSGPSCLPAQAPSLVVVDEAAALPVPKIKQLLKMAPGLLATTTGGYEGTGQVFSLKVLAGANCPVVTLSTPIRYSKGDPLEAWLNKGLGLSVMLPCVPQMDSPKSCSLYLVNKRALLCGAPEPERVLQGVLGVLQGTHYRSSPSDLQMLSDHPGHSLFVLISRAGTLIGVIHAAQEGGSSLSNSLTAAPGGVSSAVLVSGHLIPSAVSEYYQDQEFSALNGLRIVRVAVHPEVQGMGYGTRMIELLIGAATLTNTTATPTNTTVNSTNQANQITNSIFLPAAGVGHFSYLGVSFGATPRVLSFWERLGFLPLYLRQTKCQATGEHTLIVAKGVAQEAVKQIEKYAKKLALRLLDLLPGCFRALPPGVALCLLQVLISERPTGGKENRTDPGLLLEDLDRIKRFVRGNLELRLIADLIPRASRQLLLCGRSLSHTQQALLLGVGLQHRGIDGAAESLSLSVPQARTLLIKSLATLEKTL